MLDVLVVAFIAIFVGLVFYKTVLSGQPITKLYLLAEWDSVFRSLSTGQSLHLDPSSILLMVPYYMLVSRLWHNFEIPLWNQNSGFGMPLLADPQALAFTPLHFGMAIDPSLRTYNLTLVFELTLLALGGYAMGRALGLSRAPSIFLALTLLACPYEQWYLELLGNGYCLIPFLFTAFLQAARRRTMGSAVVAGLLAGVVVLSSHPELSFSSITFASLLLICLVPFGYGTRLQKSLASLRKSLIMLTIAGGVAFCLCAPMLLSFVEFLVNSDSYKFGNRAPAYIPLQTMIYDMVLPGFGGASPYLGVLACLCLPLAIVTIFNTIFKPGASRSWERRSLMVVGALSLVAWVVSAKLWPLSLLLTQRPFSYVVVTYFFPIVLVLIAAVAAFGLERAISLAMGDVPKDKQHDLIVDANHCYRHAALVEWLILGGWAALIVLFPALIKQAHVNLGEANFDMTLPGMAFSNHDWLKAGITTGLCLVLFAAIRWARRRAKPSFIPVICVCALIGLGLFTQLSVARKSLPGRPDFTYPEPETIALLKQLGGRFVAIGNHTLKPNTNLVYGLNDLRSFNAMFPARYLSFLKAAGANLTEFNQEFSEQISPLLNLASVNYIVTPDAIFDRSVFAANSKYDIKPTDPFEWNSDLSITSLKHAVDRFNSAIYVQVTWKCRAKPGRYSYNVVLVNKRGEPLWISDLKPIGIKLEQLAPGTQPLDGSSTGAVSTQKELVPAPTIPSQATGKNLAVQGKSSAPQWQVVTVAAPIRSTVAEGDVLSVKIGVFETSGLKRINAAGTTLPSDKDGVNVAKVSAPPVAGLSEQPLRRFKLLAETHEGMRIYENTEAVPNAYIVTRINYAKSKDEVLEKLMAEGSNWFNAAVIEAQGTEAGSFSQERNEANQLALSFPYARVGSAELYRRSSNHVVVCTDSADPGYLVVTDQWFPGWHATLDGNSVPILKANHAFRAVEIPTGKHTVEFRYLPVPFLIGCALSSSMILTLFGMFLQKIINVKNEKSGEPPAA